MINTINKIYYINLDRRKDRQNHMIQEISKSKYLSNAIKYEGIDGKTLDPKKLDTSFITTHGVDKVLSNRVNRWGNDLTYGSLGCGLTHYNIYKECIDKNYRCVLILEDDIRLLSEIDKAIEYSLKLNFNDFDIFYFGYHNTPSLREPVENNIYKIESYIYGCFAYLITLNGAKKIINTVFPISQQIDTEISIRIMQKKLNAYIYMPKCVCTLPKFGTDNQGKNGLIKTPHIVDPLWEELFSE